MKSYLTENLSYKFVALGVAVILWMSMLGRKDSTLVREFELQVILPAGIELASTLPSSVKVEVAGPRVALKKINQQNPVFQVDLTSARLGSQLVTLRYEGLSLPIGARILSIEPRNVPVVLKESVRPAGDIK